MNDLIPGANEGKILSTARTSTAARRPVEVRRRVGMVFQKPNPFPKSIFENVAFGPRVHGTHGRYGRPCREPRRAALWDEVKDRLNTRALGLSGGQQQRLCIARASLSSPKSS